MGVSRKFWAVFGLAAAAVVAGCDDLPPEPERVDPSTAYCDVQFGKSGKITKAFVREARNGQAVYRLEPGGFDDWLASGKGQVVGTAVDVRRNQFYGSFVADGHGCIVTDGVTREARSYVPKPQAG